MAPGTLNLEILPSVSFELGKGVDLGMHAQGVLHISTSYISMTQSTYE